MNNPKCRFSGKELKHTFVDLGLSPIANNYLKPEQLSYAEKFYPLHVYVSEDNFLVQVEEFESPEDIFGEYTYFSSYSGALLENAQTYTNTVVERFNLNQASQVMEIASNDGYLLQYFLEKNIPVLGIEPAGNVAKVAQEKGIPTIVKFFGVNTAQELVASGKQADLLAANNVIAHVPDLNDFVAGMKILLKPEGVITVEFHHLLNLITKSQFDSIYHEHFSYFSLLSMEKVMAAHGLKVFDVEEISTHGGSLRVYACHQESSREICAGVAEVKDKEIAAGLTRMETYLAFGEKVKATKRQLLSFLIEAKTQGKSIVGYGAPAKAITLLNYCGVRTDFIDYIVDRSPHKQGSFVPGTRLPILAPEKIAETKPDYLLILPWNLKEEIMTQMAMIRDWGGKFVVPIPEVQVY